MTAKTVELLERESPPEKWLDEAAPNATRTDEYDHAETVLPITLAAYERERRLQMVAGYREMGELDRSWAEQDLPATYEVLPDE